MMCLAGSPSTALAILGVECSTFVAINKGTSRRDELNPWGDPIRSPAAAAANKSTSR